MANHHPIQIEAVRVLELALNLKDPEKALSASDLPFKFSTGHTKFDPDQKAISVGVIGEIGTSDDDTPFHVKVHLIGVFSVNTDVFPLDKVEDWAQNNAPLLLLPFLREHIYGLCNRAGLKEVFVPLLVIPNFKLN